MVVRNTQFICKCGLDLDTVLEELLNTYIEIKQNLSKEYKDLFDSFSIQGKLSLKDFEMFGRYIDPDKFLKNHTYYKKVFIKEYDFYNI